MGLPDPTEARVLADEHGIRRYCPERTVQPGVPVDLLPVVWRPELLEALVDPSAEHREMAHLKVSHLSHRPSGWFDIAPT
jgi:hypothetical protein